MELLVQLIFVIAILKYCLKASLAGGLRAMLLYGLGAGIWALTCYPLVILQPVTIVENLLADREVVINGAVLTSLEAIVGILLAVSLLDNYFAPRERRSRLLFLMKILPGLLTPVAILYFELIFFKIRVGGDFLVTALLYAGICLGGVMSVAWIMKRGVEGESLKLELKLLLNLAILVIGLLINSSVADYNISSAHVETEWGAMIALGGIVILFIALGYFTRNINLKNILKWIR